MSFGNLPLCLLPTPLPGVPGTRELFFGRAQEVSIGQLISRLTRLE